VDVRAAAERETGAIPGSMHLPLAELPARHHELPANRRLVLHCGGGHRSSIAASLLRHHGHTDVCDLLGGYTAWAALETRDGDATVRVKAPNNDPRATDGLSC
jgi:rhodanese-related sulfurtransferase